MSEILLAIAIICHGSPQFRNLTQNQEQRKCAGQVLECYGKWRADSKPTGTTYLAMASCLKSQTPPSEKEPGK